MTDDQVNEILHELRLIREALSNPPRRRVHLDEAHVALARAIAAATGGRIFTASEAVEHARLDGQEALGAAIAGVCGGSLNPRRLGKALRRIEGSDVGNVVVERVGADGSGVLWVCRVSVPVETPLRRFSIA
jgi:hypothetical protein